MASDNFQANIAGAFNKAPMRAMGHENKSFSFQYPNSFMNSLELNK